MLAPLSGCSDVLLLTERWTGLFYVALTAYCILMEPAGMNFGAADNLTATY